MPASIGDAVSALVWKDDFPSPGVPEHAVSPTADRAMPTEQQMKQAMQAYIDLYNKDDLEGVVGLYADEAIVEDPVGSPVKSGKIAIREFYAYSMKTGARLTLAAPIRGSHGNSAAMAFDVNLKYKGAQMVIRVIDVMTFDAAGKFASMKAYWGPSDMQK